jgi:hypothetical protein
VLLVLLTAAAIIPTDAQRRHQARRLCDCRERAAPLASRAAACRVGRRRPILVLAVVVLNLVDPHVALVHFLLLVIIAGQAARDVGDGRGLVDGSGSVLSSDIVVAALLAAAARRFASSGRSSSRGRRGLVLLLFLLSAARVVRDLFLPAHGIEGRDEGARRHQGIFVGFFCVVFFR